MAKKVRSETRKLRESRFKGWNDTWKPWDRRQLCTEVVASVTAGVWGLYLLLWAATVQKCHCQVFHTVCKSVTIPLTTLKKSFRAQDVQSNHCRGSGRAAWRILVAHGRTTIKHLYSSRQAREDSKSVFTQQVTGFRQASPLNSTQQICSTRTIYLHRYIRSLCKLWVLAAQKQRKKICFTRCSIYKGNPVINRISGNSHIDSGLFWPSHKPMN